MAAHARSWGAIDPALRPPLSSVPPRTMAGAFYSSPVFPKQPPARSQTTYAGQDPSHFASHRLENEDHPKDFLNRFPCIHPVMHLSVTLLKNWNNISNQILHFFSNFCQFPNRRHQSHCGGEDRMRKAMTAIGLSVIDLPTAVFHGQRWREKERRSRTGSIRHLVDGAHPRQQL